LLLPQARDSKLFSPRAAPFAGRTPRNPRGFPLTRHPGAQCNRFHDSGLL